MKTTTSFWTSKYIMAKNKNINKTIRSINQSKSCIVYFINCDSDPVVLTTKVAFHVGGTSAKKKNCPRGEIYILVGRSRSAFQLWYTISYIQVRHSAVSSGMQSKQTCLN